MLLADGSSETIGKIVNQKLPVEVLSYDPDQGRMVPRKVVDWYDNGVADRFLQISVARPSGKGRMSMAVTENHQILTPGGWRDAGELLVGDRVMVKAERRLSEQQWELVLGALMGDGNLSRPVNGGSHSARFRMGHGAKQAAYLNWKCELLSNIGMSRTTNAKGACFADLTPLPELGELREVVYQGDGKKHLTWDYLKALTPLSLATWYMDDGSFTMRAKGLQDRTRGGSGRAEICVEAMSVGSRERLVELLDDTFKLKAKLHLRGARKMAMLTFSKDETEKLHKLVAPYVHPSMSYKLLPKYQGQFAVEPQFVEPVLVAMPSVVTEVRIKPPTRSMHRFDIQVEGSHTYLADGVIVHNSPETTTGGKALKFYATMRLDVRRIETLKDGTEAVGNKVRVKVVKNKVASPFRQAELEITYGSGISRVGGLVDMGVEHGFVRKSGAWYTYEGDQLGQGRENAKQFLLDNPDLADEIEKKIKEKLGVGPVLDAPVDLTADAVAPEPVDF